MAENVLPLHNVVQVVFVLQLHCQVAYKAGGSVFGKSVQGGSEACNLDIRMSLNSNDC